MVNQKLAKEKGLINDNDDLYRTIFKEYKYILEYYLSTIIDFNNYEKRIKNSGLSIGINKKYKLLNEFLKLDYIFLINNLFVEKLNIEDIHLIMREFDKNNISNELVELVKRTYKSIIYDNYVNNTYQDMVYKVCYGPMVPINFADNNALVFKIYYGKNLVDLDGDDFIELHDKQLAFFDNLISEFKNEVKEKLDVNCEVLLEKDIY